MQQTRRSPMGRCSEPFVVSMGSGFSEPWRTTSFLRRWSMTARHDHPWATRNASSRMVRSPVSGGWLLLVLLNVPGLFHATTAEAQQIRGRVLDDASGAMLAPALVTLRVEGADSVAASIVAESGAFELALAQGGRYSIRVELLGYQSTTNLVEIPQGSVITVELRLRPDAIPLQPLRILAERARLGVARAPFARHAQH
jgi:hypothetical protein